MQFSLAYSTWEFVVFLSSLSSLGGFGVVFLSDPFLSHSEDWRCPGVAGALLSLGSTVVFPFAFSSFEGQGCSLHVC